MPANKDKSVTTDANKHCQRMKLTKGKKPNEKQSISCWQSYGFMMACHLKS